MPIPAFTTYFAELIMRSIECLISSISASLGEEGQHNILITKTKRHVRGVMKGLVQLDYKPLDVDLCLI